MAIYSYSDWDGSQDLSWLNAEDLLKEISEDLLSHGDLSRALRRLTQRGLQGPGGDKMKGLQDLMQQLRTARQEFLNQYDLGSVLDDIKEKLEGIVRTEREGIGRRLEEAQGSPQTGEANSPQEQGADRQRVAADGQESLRKALERIAEKNLSALDNLPKDPAGQIQQLSNYEFLDPTARQQFKDLMDTLQQRMMDQYVQNMMQGLQSMSPEQMGAVRQMIRDLNSMLQEKMRGGEPDFDSFMQKWGQFFPDNPRNLDELVANMQKRAAQMQSLLDSLPEDKRRALRDVMDSLIQDQAFKDELGQLAAGLEYLQPMRQFKNRYLFRGDESLSLSDAMEVMDDLQRMDDLEKQMVRAQHGGDVADVDAEAVQEFLGDEASQTLEQLRHLTEMLEESGFIRMNGGRMELTPRGMRKIGQKALQDIFAQIKKDQFGKHETDWKGAGGERSDETKGYEFGDPFDLHLERTLMNALRRDSDGVPLRLSSEDFEVYQSRYFSQSSIVLMLDISWSMGLRGNFFAAKKVAIAMDNLIRMMFPKDSLYIVAFSRYAKELKRDSLTYANVDEYAYGTNMHQALMVAQKLLSKHKAGNKQIIMITDGEPTAHLEGGRVYFQYPPSLRTLEQTLKEVKRCTKQGIVINTFMLDSNFYMMEFIDQVTKINRGRVFYTTPDKLGQYILVDYMASKRKKIA